VRKRVIRFAFLCVAVLALGAAGFALAGTTTLSLTYVGPEPDTVTVPWGDTLRITNADTVAHSLVSSHPELRTGVLLPGKTFTATISGPAHNYSFRQTGGKGFPGKIEVDFSGHVSLSPSSTSVSLGRAVRLKGTTNLHSTPVLLQMHRSSGAYAATVRLQRGGKLRATVAAGQIRSAVKLVDVRPKLTASRRGGGVTAKLNPAGAALLLTLECRIGPGRWKRIASKRPSGAGVVSFAVRSGRGLVRVAATHSAAKEGFAPQASRALSAAC
jgi:hypothetical protein